MRNFKIALWAIVILFLGLVIFQNMEALARLMTLKLNLWVAGSYESREIPVGIWLLAALLLGVLVAYFGSLMARFRAHRTIKGLTAKLESVSTPDLTVVSDAVSAPEENEAPVS